MPVSRLEAVCKEQDAKWLHRLSLGIDDEEVCSYPVHFSLTRPAWPKVGAKSFSEDCHDYVCSYAQCAMRQIAAQDCEGSYCPNGPP